MELDERLVKCRFIDEDCARICSDSMAAVVNFDRWIIRFDEVFAAVDGGDARQSQLDDHVFELKVMCWIANNIEGMLTYEPQPAMGEKNCDLLLSANDGDILVEVKAIHPGNHERSVPDEYIAPNNTVDMDPQSYHAFQATYGHLIDKGLEVEKKLAGYPDAVKCVMALWLNHNLDVEALRDFVAFYRGVARADDPLSVMGAYKMKQDQMSFSQVIGEFWGFPFNEHNCGFRRGEVVSVAPLEGDDRCPGD